MGCCASASNQVTPHDTPVKHKKYGFEEKEIVLSRQDTSSTILINDTRSKGNKQNKIPDKSSKPSEPVKPYVPVKPKPPPPKKELEIISNSILDGHIQYVDIASWAPAADTVFTASRDRRAILWDVSVPAAVEKVELAGTDLEYPVSCVGWSDDGEIIGLGHEDGKVSLWEKTGNHLFTWWPHEAPVNCVVVRWEETGSTVLSAGDCAAASKYLLDSDVQELTQLYFSNSVDLSWVEWVDQTKFITSDVAGNIELHNFDLERLQKKIKDGKYEDKEKAHRTFPGHSAGVYQVKMKPGSSGTFASCSVDCSVKVWDIRNKEDPLVHSLEDHIGYVTCLCWVPSTDLLVSAGFDYTVKIWNSRAGSLIHSLEKHHDAITQISLSPDSLYIVSAGQDGDLHFWSLEDGVLVNTYEGAGRIVQASFNHTGMNVVATSYKIVTLLQLAYDENQRALRMQPKKDEKEEIKEEEDVEDDQKKKKKKKKHRKHKEDEPENDYEEEEETKKKKHRKHKK